MGTRAAIGWITPDSKVVATYSQSDGYPSGVGAGLQEQMTGWDTLPTIDRLDAIRLVDPREKPTQEEALQYADMTDHRVSTGDDWYATLRMQQGRLDLILQNGIMTDDSDFPRDSLFCEWAYLIDTRSDEMVILKGFTDQPGLHPDYLEPLPKTGRAGGDSYYYPCREVWRGTLEAFLGVDMQALENRLESDEAAA